MPDDPTEPPDWHRDNKGRVRDSFAKKPEPEQKPEPAQENQRPDPPSAEKPPQLRYNPKNAWRFQDNSGKPFPTVKTEKPRKHTKEQIAEWGEQRRGILAKKHRATTDEMNAQHDLEKKSEKGADAATLKNMTDRHKLDQARLDKQISKDKSDLEALIAKSHDAEQIPDRQYVEELDRRAKHTPEQINEWAQHRRDRLDETIHERWKELHDRHAGNPDLGMGVMQAETTNLQRQDNNDMAALDNTIATAHEIQQIPDHKYLQEHGMETPERDTGRDTGRTYDDGGGRGR